MAAAPASADTVRNAQLWVLNAVSAPQAWQLTEGQGTTVAVIDSGVNPDVSDLAGSVITGPDLTGVHTPMSNPNWGVHGTWMASLIAGHGHDGGGSGIMGIAPRSRVLSIRVVTDRKDPGYAAYQHESDSRVQDALAQAIGYAVAHKVSVISMSLGYGEPSAVVRTALQNALDHGVVVVASSGNSGESVGARAMGQAPYSFPADYPGVLGVAAVSRSGAPAGFSSDNLSVQVAAPGVNVPAQGRDGQYWLVSGTSPACALTAGVAALIKARYPGLAPALVVRAITSSTRNPPPGGYDDKVGFGTVDAAAALAAAGRLAGHLRPSAGLPVGTLLRRRERGRPGGSGPAARGHRAGHRRAGRAGLPGAGRAGRDRAGHAAPGGRARPARRRAPAGRARLVRLPGAGQLAGCRGARLTGGAGQPDPGTLPDFASRVLDIADMIPPGRVMSYGDVAEYLGRGGPRQVGRVMALWGGSAPWWRVVHADGSLLRGHERAALAAYQAEGTPLRTARAGGPPRIDMRLARWDGRDPSAG